MPASAKFTVPHTAGFSYIMQSTLSLVSVQANPYTFRAHARPAYSLVSVQANPYTFPTPARPTYSLVRVQAR
jgi:hypothetical protein